jgi:hypothetical protein
MRLEGEAFHPATNCEVVWSATNALPRGLWIYKVMPEAFSAAVVSNAMALGQFQTTDLAKPDHPPFQDPHLIYFQNQNEFGRPRFLLIAPTLGAMKYVSQKDYKVTVKDVPTSDEAEALARDVLFRLGIDRSLLAESVRKGYDETITHADRQGHTLGAEKVLVRGVSFERRIDGVALSENWCFMIHFGSQGRIEDFSLMWRNILPSESHPVLSAGQIAGMIKSGQAVLPPQYKDLTGLESAKRMSVRKVTPRYYNGNGHEPLDFMVPYAELEMTAEIKGKGTATFILNCPIFLSSTPANALPTSQSKPPANRRGLIPKEVLDVLEKGQEFALLSLSPEPATKATNTFGGFEILGKVEIKDTKERRSVLDALYAGIALEGPEAMCFNPRHGVHAKMGEQVEDLVICFECGQIYFHGISEGKLVVNGTPAASLDRILSAARVPISK